MVSTDADYQLMAGGFPAISIAKENRLEYFNALEACAAEGNLAPFAEMTAELADRQLDRNHVAEATRRRRRIPQAGFFFNVRNTPT